jgi:hypothetical protein
MVTILLQNTFRFYFTFLVNRNINYKRHYETSDIKFHFTSFEFSHEQSLVVLFFNATIGEQKLFGFFKLFEHIFIGGH